jgi:uncharacterized membrane protein
LRFLLPPPSVLFFFRIFSKLFKCASLPSKCCFIERSLTLFTLTCRLRDGPWRVLTSTWRSLIFFSCAEQFAPILLLIDNLKHRKILFFYYIGMVQKQNASVHIHASFETIAPSATSYPQFQMVCPLVNYWDHTLISRMVVAIRIGFFLMTTIISGACK